MTRTASDLSESEGKWIDAHSHTWPSETDVYPLVEGLTKADLDPRSFTDDELMAVARPEGVGRVVLIQHSVYHLFDNRYLLDAVRRHPNRFRAVGMVDDGRDDAGERARRLLEHGVTGFRITPFIHKEHPERWLDSPGMRALWKVGAETGQAMCCLIDAEQIERVDRMCAEFPDTPVVIDHFARIGVDGRIRDPDLESLVRLARHARSHVKISAFYALGRKQPPHDELIPMIRRLMDAYGPSRLMWASDAPYQIQGVNTYRASIELVRDRLDFLSGADREWLLAKTAERVFFFR
ncbi:MAG: amidohydrolase [Planctomycetes bacterium]|nr:amidohydrolase [Planctomycetota bacterium]